MLKLFLDESGHLADSREKVFVVGGCLSSLDQWERLEGKCCLVLREYGIRQLHMKHFAHHRGEFSGWSESKRRGLLEKVHVITRDHVDKFIAAVVPMSDYNALDKGQKKLAGHPYLVAFKDCLLMAERTAQELFAPPEKIETIFSDHPKLNGAILKHYSACKKNSVIRDRLGPITFDSPDNILPLQTADLVAYELNKIGRQRLEGDFDFDKIRWPFREIIMQKIPDFEFYSVYRLEDRFPKEE
ncbi:MAG: DUF3800 domain-containing protein [Nitrospirales bacterium]